MRTERPPVLVARGLSKRFGAVRALADVALTLRAGEVHGLVGENGAGKSTLISLVAGVRAPDRGGMQLDARPFAPRSPAEARARGVSTVFQEIDLVPDLSVAENVCLGREPRGLLGIARRPMRERARERLAAVGLAVDVRLPLRELALPQRQLVAIARALDAPARVLVLDEPTASLDEGEVAGLFALVRRLAGEGRAVLLVSHFLAHIEAVCDRVTVLRNGRRVLSCPLAELDRRALVGAMLGRELRSLELPPRGGARHAAPPVAELVDARRRGALAGVRLAARPGEVLGLAGLLGSGRSESLRALFGLLQIEGGEVRYDGRAVRLVGPRGAIALGAAFTPEDRREEGLVLSLSVRENLLLALQARRGLRRLPRALARELPHRLARALAIRAEDLDAPAATLSGGNQQKVLLARWLATEPRLMLLDEPTRGVDVGARAEIERWIADLAAAGAAVVLASSELDELCRLCDRVVVLSGGRSVAELNGDELCEARLAAEVARHG